MSAHRAFMAVAFALAAGGTIDLAAQVPGQVADEGQGGWAPPSLGVRLGWDNRQRNEVLGAQLRLPVLPGGEIELMPNLDVTFLQQGFKEYQYNFEVVYVLEGRAGGLYGGAGLGLRNTVFETGEGRRTELGYTVVAGFRLVGLGLLVPQLESRWVFIDAAPLTYQQVVLGFNLALWRPVERMPR